MGDYLTKEDLKTIADIQMSAGLYADLVVDLVKKQKFESFALVLGTVHNSLRKAAASAQNVIDRVKYLESLNKE